MSSKQVLRVVSVAVLLAGLWLTTGSAQATGIGQPAPPADLARSDLARAALPLADSPSPTLGSTPQNNPNPGGDQDGDAADFSQVPWAIIGPATIAVVVGVSVGIYLLRRNRRT